MSESANKVKDISIPENFPDGSNLILDGNEKEITEFLFKEEQCPISTIIRKKIEPNKESPSEVERCFNIFLTIFKSRSQYFIERPIFTLLYSTRNLQSNNLVNMTISFLKEYINNLESIPTERILDYLIPFSILKKEIQDKSSTIVSFVMFLCEKYQTKIFLNHLLPVLELMSDDDRNRSYRIQNFHIELLTAIIQSFELDQDEIDRIEENILVKLQNDENLPIKLACAALGKVIDSTPSCKNSSVSSPLRDKKPIPSTELSLDKLNSYLNEIDSKTFVSPAIVLANVKVQIELVKNWPPNRPYIPLFQLAMQNYANSKKIGHENIYYIISFINHKFYKQLEEMLKLYIDAAHDPEIDINFADKCYQDFLNIVYSDRSLSESSSSILENSPLNLIDNPPQKIKSTHNSLILAANSLKDWNTAYDGVLRIWREITKNPDVALFPYIHDLNFSKISYLSQGLKEIMDNCEPILGVDIAIKRVEDYLNTAFQSDASPKKTKRYAKTPVPSKKKTISLKTRSKSPKLAPRKNLNSKI